MTKNRSPYFEKVVKPHLQKLHANKTYFENIEYARAKMHEAYDSVIPRLKGKWDVCWSERSMHMTNPKLRITVKMTASNEVFVDRKVGVYEFKSDKYSFNTVQETVEKFQQILQQFMKPLEVIQAA